MLRQQPLVHVQLLDGVEETRGVIGAPAELLRLIDYIRLYRSQSSVAPIQLLAVPLSSELSTGAARSVSPT